MPDESVSQPMESSVDDGQANNITDSDIQSSVPDHHSENEVAKATFSDFDWTQDDLYEKDWNKDPNKLYESYKKGLDSVKSFEDIQKKYTELDGKYTPLNHLMEYINQLNPNQKQKLDEIFNQFELESLQSKYGHLNPEVLSKLAAQDKEISEMKAFREEQELKTQTETQVSLINSALGKIDKFCEARGIDYDARDFLDYAAKNEIDPRYLESVFITHALPQIERGASQKGQNAVIKNVKETSKGSLMSGGKKTASQSGKFNLSDALDKILS